LGLALAKIEGALVEDHSLPRPQWKQIHAWIKQHVDESDVSYAWQEIAFDWLSTLRNRLGGSYSVNRSRNFLLLTSRSRVGVESILNTSEGAAQKLVRWLGPVAEKRGNGPHVILDFATLEQYYDYVSYFHSPDSHTIASGGMFLGRGYQHIALPPSNGMQSVLIHELTHNRLSHLRLPLWVEEGIAVTMERRIGGNNQGGLDRELNRKHRAYWSPETMAAFWNGNSFRNPEGEISHLSYSLAEILIDLMVQEFPNFMDFVGRADRKDAGQEAANETFDVSLNDIAAAFLGPGDWTSRIVAEPEK
jgi:hypothetical protein